MANRKKAKFSKTAKQRLSPKIQGRNDGRKRLKQAEASPAPDLDADPPSREKNGFFIVGIGASAGGLEALEEFFRSVPRKSGMAFVVVQHMDPTRKGLLVQLLQRNCEMPVVQVADRMRIEPDHVYVIPPNHDMSILHGTLHLLPPTPTRGAMLPIDFFFRSLAEDQQERSIGVLLSGMGSDGTLGLRAIKEKAGVVFVQSPASAKFNGMPRSAIESGVADVVAPVGQLPEKIITYRRHAPRVAESHLSADDKIYSELDKVFVLLRTHTGNDFSPYKKSTICRRIERRMGLHQIDTATKYVRYLRENPAEVQLLFKELLIGVTNFFRDPPAWEHLKREVMPSLIHGAGRNGILRAWVPGCSTGEEAYSLAIIFKEVLQLEPSRSVSLQIFATDLDQEAIEKARTAVYPSNIAADVSPERLRRFFVQDENGYRVSKEIRELLIFAPQNLIMDPPFTKLDILCCRNLLIYLSPELQKKLIPLFHYGLNPGGILFLGSAETIGGFSDLFAPNDGKARIYRRLQPPVATSPVEFPISFASPMVDRADVVPPELSPQRPPPNIQALADKVIAQRFSPAAVLVNEKGDILYISGRTGKYLEPAAGKANWNIFAMAREGLRFDLSAAFAQALRDHQPVRVHAVKVGTNGGTQHVDICIQRLTDPEPLKGSVIIILTDVPSPSSSGAKSSGRRSNLASTVRIAELEKELEKARDEVQTIREEMQTSQEELKSSNEELQSTNEELQSTNEELTTSKEEMQSLNEELQTVNHELQAKVDELSRSNNDMKNLLNSTDIATLFLDGNLNVRRFTNQTAKIIKLIPGDAGRPITDITCDLDYPDLADDAREVLRTLVFQEKLVRANDGRWYSVRMLPYRTLENVIDGVVITFTDATASKKLEEALREQASELKQMAESLPNLVWGSRADGMCDYLSRQWMEYTGIPEAEQLGYGWLDQVHPDDRERIKEQWRSTLKSAAPFDVELRLRGRKGTYRWFKARSVPIRDASGAISKWYGSYTDIDSIKRASPSLSDSSPTGSAGSGT